MSETTDIDTYIAGVREAIDREDGSLSSAVGIIIGAASMCWDEIEHAGVFQSDKASALIDLLLSYTGPFEPTAVSPSETGGSETGGNR